MSKISSIRSIRTRKIVAKTVEKALDECAIQHEYHDISYTGSDGIKIEPTPKMLAFAEAQPVKVKITLEFTWPDNTNMFCSPIVDLTARHKEKNNG